MSLIKLNPAVGSKEGLNRPISSMYVYIKVWNVLYMNSCQFLQGLAGHVQGGIQEASRSEGARTTARSRGRHAADSGVAPRRCSAEHGQTKHLVIRGRPLRGAARSCRRQRCRQLLRHHSQLLHCELPLPALLGKLLLQLPHAGDRIDFRDAGNAQLGRAAPRLAVSRWASCRSATTGATAASGCICIWPLLDGLPQELEDPRKEE